jgi:hypothetical protein
MADTRSDDAAVDNEQQHNNDATNYIAATRSDAKHCTEVQHNEVDDETAVDKVFLREITNDNELSQEYFMSNEFEVQSADSNVDKCESNIMDNEEDALMEREHKEEEFSMIIPMVLTALAIVRGSTGRMMAAPEEE